MKPERILNIFEESGALLKGHFQLTSGLHSDTYFQCAKVLQYPRYSELLAADIAGHFRQTEIETVITPAVGGIVVGTELARQIGARSIFCERQDGKMTLRRGFELNKGEKVLICEDVVTTGGSVFEVIELARKAGAEICGVGFIVDRSNGKVDFGVNQFSNFKMQVNTYKPEKCPLCKSGSKAVKPGSRGLK